MHDIAGDSGQQKHGTVGQGAGRGGGRRAGGVWSQLMC